jgi:tetratricopeptide (TPR) repeat protein
MAKRIILISSFPVCIALVVIALVLAGVGRGQPAASAAVPPAIAPEPFALARTNILSLTDAGKLAEVDAAIDKLASDCKDASVLTANYDIIADSFAWRRMNDRAGRLYQFIIDKSPDSSLVSKARLGLARVGILGHIEEKKFSIAQEKLDSMIADFNNEPALAGALFQIGQEFFWKNRYIEAMDAFDHISPTDSLSQNAKLWSAKVNICSLIGKAKDEEILASIDKLMNDFADNPGLAEAVYWLSKEYEWKKSAGGDRNGWYDSPNSVYQKLIQQFGGTTYGWDAEWDKKRLTHRMKIFKLMQEPNQAETDAAIEAMVTDLKGRPDLAGELLWVAWGYEEHPDKMPQAKQMYERIIREYPDNTESTNAVLDIRRLDIWGILMAGDINNSYAMIDKFIADFNTHPHLPAVMLQLGKEYYARAHRYEQEDRYEQAKEYFKKAVAVWDKIITQLPSSAYTPEACYLVAYCAFENTGDYEKAIECCQRVVINWPDYKYACDIQFLLGNYHERLAHSGLIPEPEANIIIEQAYEAVVEKYPNCDKVKNASVKLAEMNFKKGQWDKAATYYEILLATFPENEKPASVLYLLGQSYDNMGKKNEAIKAYNNFLLKANLGDPRIGNVRQRIQILTGSAKNKRILSDIVLGSIYGGCRWCAPQGLPAGCAYGGSGSCAPSVCNGINPCFCNEIGKQCYSNPNGGNCVNSSRPCSSSCAPIACHKYGSDCVTWTSVEVPCSGSLSDCHY